MSGTIRNKKIEIQGRACDFCDEFSEGRSNTFASIYGDELRCRSVFLTDNFRVIPSLGQIVEGHVMILPTAHYVAVGDLPLNLTRELQSLTELVRKALTETYRNCVFFEHGARNHEAGGCGVYHAHLHAVPLNDGNDPIKELRKHHSLIEIASLSELERIGTGHPYLYYETLGLQRFVGRVTHLPSQYMRRFVADFMGQSHWDWRKASKEASLRSTVILLSSWFARQENGGSGSCQISS